MPSPKEERTMCSLTQIDTCAIELRLQVIHIGSEKDKSNYKDTNKDRGRLVGFGGALYDTILVNNLDALHVGAGICVRHSGQW